MLNLDTHMLLHALANELRPAERKLLRANPWSISAIVLWEISKLAQLKRINVDLQHPVLAQMLRSVQIWPLTPDICDASTRLDIQSDPADELIAATSVIQRVPLLTRDTKLLRSKMIPLAG